MPIGIVTRDASNNVIMDTTVRCGRVTGTYDVPVTNGSITVVGADTGLVFATLVSIDTGSPTAFKFNPVLTISGSTISWDWGSASNTYKRACRLVYGVY